MPLPKLKYIVVPSVDFMLKQSYPNTEEEDPSKFVLPIPQSIRVNVVCRGALGSCLMTAGQMPVEFLQSDKKTDFALRFQNKIKCFQNAPEIMSTQCVAIVG